MGAKAGNKAEKNAVRTLSPAGAITPTATWSVGVRAGDFVFVAGMRAMRYGSWSMSPT